MASSGIFAIRHLPARTFDARDTERRKQRDCVRAKPEGKKRFYLGGQVYEDWANILDRYKASGANRTPRGTQVAPIFSIKW